jgi:hypothetical protein
VGRVSKQATRKSQHTVPRHMLAGFANANGRLTVVRTKPELKVLRNQDPLNVGVHKHLNNWQDEDGNWHDELEAGPLTNLDNAGKRAIEQIVRFGIEADAETHMRLLNDQSLEERASMQLFVASLMVRTMGFRERFDASALPSLLAYMSKRLEEEFAAGNTDKQTYELLKKTYATPGQVQLKPPEYQHLSLLVPLIQRVATRLHLDSYVAVRRFAEPLLFTAAEPVVIFPTADVFSACSSGKLFTEGDSPIEAWQEQDALLDQVDARLAEIAGLAVAVDPHTMLLMFHADRDDGGKLAYITSQVQAEGLADLVNIVATGTSAWIAGRDDCELLNILIRSSGAG